MFRNHFPYMQTCARELFYNSRPKLKKIYHGLFCLDPDLMLRSILLIQVLLPSCGRWSTSYGCHISIIYKERKQMCIRLKIQVEPIIIVSFQEVGTCLLPKEYHHQIQSCLQGKYQLCRYIMLHRIVQSPVYDDDHALGFTGNHIRTLPVYFLQLWYLKVWMILLLNSRIKRTIKLFFSCMMFTNLVHFCLRVGRYF